MQKKDVRSKLTVDSFSRFQPIVQYDRLLASSFRLSVCLSDRLSVTLSRSVYRAKCCTSVFLARKFLFV